MDIDKFIEGVRRHEIKEEELMVLLKMAQEIFYDEGTLINIELPITVCGDIHGQFYDLLKLFEVSGDPSTTRYLFLGDYVDRGFYSVETFALLIAYKVKYPDTFFMLRGNHECRRTSSIYGFYDETLVKFGHAGPWKMCNEIFDMLPLAALISDRVYCVHGGLSPLIKLADQVALIERRQEIPDDGPVADIVWSDPDDIPSWGINMRGAGQLYGKRPVEEFCRNNRIELIARAHQMETGGYGYRFDSKCVTVWSAPNYMYRSGNLASVMKIDEAGNRDFVVFGPEESWKRKVPESHLLPYFL